MRLMQQNLMVVLRNSSSALRRSGLDSQRMKPAGEFPPQSLVYHPMDVEAALAAKRLGNDSHTKMRLAAVPMAGMALVQVGLVEHVDRLGLKSVG